MATAIGNITFTTPISFPTTTVIGYSSSQFQVLLGSAKVSITKNTNTSVRYVHYRFIDLTHNKYTQSKYVRYAAKATTTLTTAANLELIVPSGGSSVYLQLEIAVSSSTATPSSWTKVPNQKAVSLPSRTTCALNYRYVEPSDGTVHEFASASHNVYYNKSTIVKSASNVYYTATQWNENRDAETPSHSEGDSIKITKDTTLYAVDLNTQKYHYEYEPNADGDYVKDMPETQIKPSTEGIHFSYSVPKRPGYRFLYWNKRIDGTDSEKAQPGGWTGYWDSHDVTYYAIWEPCVKVCNAGEWRDGLAYAWVDSEWLQANEQRVFADEGWKA